MIIYLGAKVYKLFGANLFILQILNKINKNEINQTLYNKR